MNRGPKPGAASSQRHEANMRAAWGEAAPVWVVVLAQAVDRASLGAIGARVGYSGSALSQAINAKYPGDLTALEKAVRGALLAESVACDILGLIPTNVCLTHQRRPFTTASPQAARLWRACRTCQHRHGGEDD